MSNKITIINAQMTCTGCSGSVTKLLKKVEGVSDVDASLETQKVTVIHDDKVTGDQLLNSLKKWAEASGKKISLA